MPKENKPLHCDLCERGFPMNGENHIGTQALGMIPTTRCGKLPPIEGKEFTVTAYVVKREEYTVTAKDASDAIDKAEDEYFIESADDTTALDGYTVKELDENGDELDDTEKQFDDQRREIPEYVRKDEVLRMLKTLQFAAETYLENKTELNRESLSASIADSKALLAKVHVPLA
jgi:hypothetical protein